MKIKNLLFILLILQLSFYGCNTNLSKSNKEIHRPNWAGIKANATFNVYDDSYGEPYIQPLNVGGWEDGLYITRNGLNLYSTYIPVDFFSLLEAFKENPTCFNYEPYYRPPMLAVDMITNPWGCKNFFQPDIVISTKELLSFSFDKWVSSNMKTSISNEGGACGVLKDDNNFDVFVFTQNRNDIEAMEIMFLKNVPINPDISKAVIIAREDLTEQINHDNPHIERLKDGSLLLFFDRDRFVYYSISSDDGDSWTVPHRIEEVINDHAPYDIQPHLWNDGTDWWVYFCKDNANGRRSIYRSKQLLSDNWNKWSDPEIVIEPSDILGNHGVIIGIGEPSLTDNGDMSFVTIYGDLRSEDSTDVYDCDPWFLPKK